MIWNNQYIVSAQAQLAVLMFVPSVAALPAQVGAFVASLILRTGA